MAMAESFLVEIDLDALRRNRSLIEGREVGEAEAAAWLKEKGFVAVPNGWMAEEKALAVLDSSEVLSCWPL
jgi:hypothetical protein